MSRNVWKRSGSGRSAGLVSADIFRPGVDDLTELGALAPNDIWDGTLIHVRSSNEVYSYDLEAVNLPDGLNVIEPATGVGRWLRIAFSGSSTATSGFADKWIDVTKITPTETITVDRTSSDDWPQEVRREEITIDGVLDVVDGYVIVGGPNLAEVLNVFNATQGIDIDVSDGDTIQYGDSPAAPVAPAGKGKIRYNQATVSLQSSVDGGPWTDLGAGGGGSTLVAPETFVFRPAGVAEGNVYTDFALLYADLSAASGHKILVLDDTGGPSVAIPDGVYDLTNTEVTNGKVSSEDLLENRTRVTWGTLTELRDASRWENLTFFATGAGGGSPIVYTKNLSVAMVGSRFYGVLSSDPIVKSVPAAATVDLLWEMDDSFLGYYPGGTGGPAVALPSEPVLELAGGGDTIAFKLKGASIIAWNALVSGAADTVDYFLVDPGSYVDPSHPSFAGTLPTIPLGSEVVYFDPTGLIVISSFTVDGALRDLDGAIGSAGGTITVTTDVALSAGDLVAFNSSGNVVLADPSLALSPDRYEVRGVASAAAIASASTPIYVDNGDRIPVRFGFAPAGALNGSRVYLDITAGLATTSVPPNGNALVKVGILVGADGVTSTPDVVVDFDVIALLP
jgi:hypothetical protein